MACRCSRQRVHVCSEICCHASFDIAISRGSARGWQNAMFKRWSHGFVKILRCLVLVRTHLSIRFSQSQVEYAYVVDI